MSEWIGRETVAAFAEEETDAYRLCTFPDGWIERFGSDVLVSYKTEAARDRLTSDLQDWAASVNVSIARVFGRYLPKQNAERESPQLLSGDAANDSPSTALERGLRYGIDFSAGYSVGLFVDQRENRSYLRALRPTKVLNCFAYTCAFSVAAASVGAETTSVDLSKKSLARGRENFALNQLPTDGHRFIAEDVMEFLPRLARKGARFDGIILDPPTFSRSPRGAAFQVERDFESLLAAALEVATRDAHLLLSTNCTSLNERALENMARFCLKSARRGGSLHRTPGLPDFPAEVGARTVWMTLR